MNSLENLKVELRAYVASAKNGMTLKQMEQDYCDTNGTAIPYTQYGFATLEQLLETMQDKILITKCGSELYLRALSDGSTAHLDCLIRSQRMSTPTRMGGIVPGAPRTRRRISTGFVGSRPLRPALQLPPYANYASVPFKPGQQSSDSDNFKQTAEVPEGTWQSELSQATPVSTTNVDTVSTTTDDERTSDACQLLESVLSRAPNYKMPLAELTVQCMKKLRAGSQRSSPAKNFLGKQFFEENDHLFELSKEQSMGTFVTLKRPEVDTVSLSLNTLLVSNSADAGVELSANAPDVTRRLPRSLPPSVAKGKIGTHSKKTVHDDEHPDSDQMRKETDNIIESENVRDFHSPTIVPTMAKLREQILQVLDSIHPKHCSIGDFGTLYAKFFGAKLNPRECYGKSWEELLTRTFQDCVWLDDKQHYVQSKRTDWDQYKNSTNAYSETQMRDASRADPIVNHFASTVENGTADPTRMRLALNMLEIEKARFESTVDVCGQAELLSCRIYALQQLINKVE